MATDHDFEDPVYMNVIRRSGLREASKRLDYSKRRETQRDDDEERIRLEFCDLYACETNSPKRLGHLISAIGLINKRSDRMLFECYNKCLKRDDYQSTHSPRYTFSNGSSSSSSKYSKKASLDSYKKSALSEQHRTYTLNSDSYVPRDDEEENSGDLQYTLQEPHAKRKSTESSGISIVSRSHSSASSSATSEEDPDRFHKSIAHRV